MYTDSRNVRISPVFLSTDSNLYIVHVTRHWTGLLEYHSKYHSKELY